MIRGGSRPGRTYLVLLVLHELVHEVRADEARPTSDQDPQVSLDQAAIRHPVIRIRNTRDRGQAPRRRSKAQIQRCVGIARSPGRTWRSGGARGSAAGGWRCARRCCHWSPSAPSRGAPGPAQIQPKAKQTTTRQRNHTHRNETRPGKRSRDGKSSERREEGEGGARRSPRAAGSLRIGFSACLARTPGNGRFESD